MTQDQRLPHLDAKAGTVSEEHRPPPRRHFKVCVIEWGSL